MVAPACLALALTACTNSQEYTQMPSTDTNALTRAEWDATAKRSVFFGHQSVGENMLDGLRRISEFEHWPALRVVELSGEESIEGPMLAHAKIGQNGDPQSKVRGFQQAMDAGIGRRVDIALMKYCFWDVRRETNVEAVFSDYRKTMDDLARRYPNVIFVHTTVPLVAADVDWRARIRRLLGMSTSTDADNAVRETLNRKIRETYGASQVLLDIAKAESESGRASNPPQLAEELSSDGAHLNDTGRRRVGAAFVKALSAASSRVRTER
jgi:hypothetical protein